MLAGKVQLILYRLWQALPVVFGVIIITFILTRALPGDPAVYFAGPAADAKSIAEIRKSLGLDQPLPVQFWLYLESLAKGDLGQSLSTGQPVAADLARRLPASLELTFTALFLSTIIALPIGILAALNPGRWIDHLCRFLVTAGVSLPTFFTGLALLFFFYYLLGWAPSPIGRLDFAYIPPPHVTGFYVPDALMAGDIETARAAAAQLLLPIARMTRAAMLQALSSDYIRTARAAGLSPRKIVNVYALQNALLPVITTLGMVFSFTLGANVLVEKVFAWPGIGSYAVEALVVSDYAAVQGFVLSMALLFVLLNLTVDVLYTLVDPRIRLDG
jgi:peptide/nickel transport system permease protein